MKNYEVTGRSVNVHTGTLRLSPDQAQRRLYALEPLGKGIFRLKKPTMFKHGEVFGFDGDLPKAQAREVAVTDKPVKSASATSTAGVAAEARARAGRKKKAEEPPPAGNPPKGQPTPAPTPAPTQPPA